MEMPPKHKQCEEERKKNGGSVSSLCDLPVEVLAIVLGFHDEGQPVRAPLYTFVTENAWRWPEALAHVDSYWKRAWAASSDDYCALWRLRLDWKPSSTKSNPVASSALKCTRIAFQVLWALLA